MNSPRTPRATYRRKTIAQKLEILDYLRNVAHGNKKETARHFDIDPKSIYDYLMVEGKKGAQNRSSTRCRTQSTRLGTRTFTSKASVRRSD